MHSCSYIGKIQPVYEQRLRHRRHVHSLIVWAPLTIAGFIFYKPIGWICLGAITPIIIDSWNLSGVAMILPFTEKIFVLASKKYTGAVDTWDPWEA